MCRGKAQCRVLIMGLGYARRRVQKGAFKSLANAGIMMKNREKNLETFFEKVLHS